MFKYPSILKPENEEERMFAEALLFLKKAYADAKEIEKEEIEWAESHENFSWNLNEEERSYMGEE